MSTDAGRIRIGIAGWAYDDWKGWFYPEDLPSGEELPWVAGYFDVVEVNSSFYRPPSPRTAERWVAKTQSNPGFRFTAKLWKRFTHERDTPPSSEEIRLYRDGIRPLVEAGRLSGVLAQFPWSFRNDARNREWLDRILDAFSDLPMFVEFRHAGWASEPVYEHLRRRGVGFVNIDQPRLRDCLAPSAVVTSNRGYFRLHGRNREAWFARDRPSFERYDYLYDRRELAGIEELVRRIAEQAPEETIVITNNHYRGQAPANAFQLKRALTGSKPLAPAPLLRRYPALREDCVPDHRGQSLPF